MILIGLLSVTPLIALPPALALALVVARFRFNLVCSMAASSLMSAFFTLPVASAI